MNDESVIVVGAGIAGLTAASLLAHQGINVTLFESHSQPGGCAGTFRRGKYIFDVGATQVAGLEPGGIHDRIFRHLGISSPKAELLNPGCSVYLLGDSKPINIWYDRKRWVEERKLQFPGTELFWSFCDLIHKNNWSFVERDPILPIKNRWDFVQLLKALRPGNYISGCLTALTVEDFLKIIGCNDNLRLKEYLDLQLKLYSQEKTDRTSLLYGASVLNMIQEPLGLWHLSGSMQKLSDRLLSSLLENNAEVLFNKRVINLSLIEENKGWQIEVIDIKGNKTKYYSNDVIFTLPPQKLIDLMPSLPTLNRTYYEKLQNLPRPQGAIVFYGAINRSFLPENYSSHIQLASNDLGSLFISISQNGDGRAPLGTATITASLFTEVSYWSSLNNIDYQKEKQLILGKILRLLNSWLDLDIGSNEWLHKELATPRSFAKWTGRPNGIVGGLGQHPLTSGIFGLPSRTPLEKLWLCGDSIHPGEGTAGVSQSAFMACRQLLANRGKKLLMKN